MKYYENTYFYDEQNNDNNRKEISEEDWKYFVNERAKGKIIFTNNKGLPELKDYIYTPQELAQRELYELKNWYDAYYTHHEQKYRRLHSLGLKTDEGKDAYTELLSLYAEAETNRKRIQELKELTE